MPELGVRGCVIIVMATYFDQFQSGFARAMPDFNLLKVRAA